jgi:hypothetical protein
VWRWRCSGWQLRLRDSSAYLQSLHCSFDIGLSALLGVMIGDRIRYAPFGRVLEATWSLLSRFNFVRLTRFTLHQWITGVFTLRDVGLYLKRAQTRETNENPSNYDLLVLQV